MTLTGRKGPTETVYPGLHIEPNETRGFLAPQHQITQAPLDWLRLQRDWWSGTMPLPPAPPAYQPSGTRLTYPKAGRLQPLGRK